MKNYYFIYAFLVMLLSFSSCAVKKSITQDVQEANQRLVDLADRLRQKTALKLEEGNIDTADAETLNTKINKVEQRAEQRKADMQRLANYQKGVFTRIANNGNLRSVERRLSRSIKGLPNDAREYDIINEALDLSAMFRFDKTAFFAPGKYIVPTEIRPKAQEVFKPIIDTLIAFANKYPDHKLKAKIVSFGYSDNTPTPKGSELYNDMAMRLQEENLTLNQINSYLSFLRAQDIASVISTVLDQEDERINKPENISILILKEGKGTEYPDPALYYSKNDERRRVVKIYWNILPE